MASNPVPMVVFTERELSVIAPAIERQGVDEIASRLGVPPDLVATHLEHVGEKFRLAARMYRAATGSGGSA